MKIEIVQASEEDKEIMEMLMQFYFYDFSEFTNDDINNDGRYEEYPYLALYWEEKKNRFPYLVNVNGKHAGFVLVRYHDEHNEDATFSIAEFFIMKKYRRMGIGKQVAWQIFDWHQGKWEVTQMKENKLAQAFWLNVINEFTKGTFTDEMEESSRKQVFTNGTFEKK